MPLDVERLRGLWKHSNRIRLAASVGAGLVAAGLLRLLDQDAFVLIGGADVGAIVYVVWVYVTSMGLDAEQTRALATKDDPGRIALDAVLLLASVGALAAVAEVIAQGSKSKGVQADVRAGLGALSVVCAWFLVHTVFMLRYARLYYGDAKGGIDFNEKEEPRFADFAYLAFTVGMTFQVSDTQISSGIVRRTILRHALLAYLFGTVFVATTINLVAGLGH